MNGSSEILSTLVSALRWIHLLMLLALAVVAVVKLRATPAGLLLGLSFALMTFCNGASKIYRLVALDPENMGYGDDYLMQLQAIGWTSSLANTVLWLAVAVGVGLLPLSLRRLAQRQGSAPA